MRSLSLLSPLLLVLLVSSSPADDPVFLSVPLSRRPLRASRAFSNLHRPWAAHLTRPSAPFRRHTKLPSDWHKHLTQTPIFDPPLPPPTSSLSSPTNSTNSRALSQQPLHGGIVSLGEYFITLTFGGQPINVQLDTGSSTLAVPLKQCLNCRAHDHRLDLQRAQGTAGFIGCESPACTRDSCRRFPACTKCSRKSRACCSVAAPDACGFYLLYADQSGASGALVQADVGIAGLSVPLVFGAILRETADFENTNVDGIFGMAYKSLACNPTCVEPLFETLVESGKVKHEIFSICTAENGGSLTLGGSDSNQYEGELQYVPMLQKSERHFYDVKVRQVTIDGKKIHVPDFDDAIIDSGTTLLVLAPKAYQAIKNYFQTHYCHVPGLCVDRDGKGISPEARVIKKMDEGVTMGGADELVASERGLGAGPSWFNPGYCVRLDDRHVEMLPDISIGLGNGVELVVDPNTYMLKFETDSRFAWEKVVYRCLGVSPLDSLELMENNVIIGNSVLQKYFVEYDRQNQRFGFAVAKNCVDPAAKLLGASSVLGDVSTTVLPRWGLGVMMLATLAAWVTLIAICTRESRKRSGYQQIPDSAR